MVNRAKAAIRRLDDLTIQRFNGSTFPLVGDAPTCPNRERWKI